jgi:hypothetical protein
MSELSAVVAKMNCSYIQTQDFGGSGQYHKVQLGAVYGKDGENKDFADATPAGECWMNINAGCPALGFFKPNKKYYVTFTEAPD